jgi:hypothetical protein
MKNKLTIIAVVLCIGLFSCKQYTSSNNNGLFVSEIDSCEYVTIYQAGIVHKQNCKYCAERNKLRAGASNTVMDYVPNK